MSTPDPYSFKIEVPEKSLEKELIKAAFNHIQQRKTLYILIDDAHLIDMWVLRKLRLLFEQYPKKHRRHFVWATYLLHYLSLNVNQDIKSRITYSATLKPLNNDALECYIIKELRSR